jgi:hypothetical protein
MNRAICTYMIGFGFNAMAVLQTTIQRPLMHISQNFNTTRQESEYQMHKSILLLLIRGPTETPR